MQTLTLYPYKLPNFKSWVFDDARTGLKEEAFVSGMSEMLDRMVEAKGIADAERGVSITFGAEAFEGADVELRWLQEGEITFLDEEKNEKSLLVGNWYFGKVDGVLMVGWLCPALLKYFQKPPQTIYVSVSPLPVGVDPIWHDAPKKEAYVLASDELVFDPEIELKRVNWAKVAAGRIWKLIQQQTGIHW